ncbi:apoptotic chromatin condensation inducer in the nucleus-like [Pocillopora verrucosa]|uniref:apoptotic chromatin condensation inducer in the nucleus-like n=1 Tax=Pocillopora verrucosa TaxID=203993 RepID=UPI00334237ED
MAEREITIRGRRLSQLKVDELKVELEKRGLKKSGNKGVLIERLQEAIDKEMEMKEGFESYPVPQQAPARVGEPWPHPMMQQQQQPGGFPVQPMGIPQGMINQQQGLLNQPHVMMNQQQMMMHQQQQITSPVQVKEFREQWPQAQIPPPQMLYQQPREQQVLNQLPLMADKKPLTHASNHQVPPPVLEPEVESSSSSDNEQDSAQQSSSSSSQESDDHEQERPTSLLNYNYSNDSRTEARTAPVVHESKPITVQNVEEQSKESASLAPKEEEMKKEEDVAANDRPELGQDEKADVEMDGEKTVAELKGNDIKDEENKKKVVDEGEDGRQNEVVGKEKEGEVPSESLENKEPVSTPSPAEENTFEVEPSEEDKAVVEEPKVPSPQKPSSPVVTKKRKINIPRTSLPTTPTSEGQPGSRKRRWGSSSSSKKTSLSISTDSLKDLIPGVQVHSTPALEAVMDIRGDDNDEEDDEPEEKRKIEQKTDEEKEELSAETMPEVKDEGRRRKDRIVKVEEKKTIKLQRKLVVVETEPDTLKMEVEEEPSENKLEDNPYPRRLSAPVQEESPIPAGKRSPSPAKNPPCKTLHVKNLVRPFTLNQLKDLLGKHGTLVQDGFWIDRIKSHCYVVYTDEDDAVASRQALHGIKWPATSPKILDVDYADDDEMARDTDGLLGREKEKERELNAEKDEIKERAVEEEKPMVTEEKEEEEEDQKNAGNLLDNLFKKTKTIPCLYWLPLTDEQIATREREREERRKARQDERDKEEQERKERQQQREKERELEREKEKRERETTEKQRSRSPRNRRRERSKSRSRSRGPRRR